MQTAVITHLRCPVCREPLAPAEHALRCPRGHSFDIARQGYADLTAGRPVHTGDTAEMVVAREALLTAGHFAALSTAVAALVAGEPPGLVVEVGAGTAHYLAAALGPDRDGLAVDTSKAALKRAAQAHGRIGAVRADIWQGLPLADDTAAVVLDIFAPRSGAEFARVLAPGGALVVATPAAGHLAELVTALGLITVDPAKEERLHKSLDQWFVRTGRHRVRDPLGLTRAEAEALVGMGPSAWHTDPDTIRATIAAMPEPITATLDVDLSVWRPYI
ncbi:putative RNA methyltransferase [Dactylosporangium sp. NPDC051541]|uniref:putative RNA methyltransferase n=1 Tax=Dactylosporangium sp. NPDC051541 TaxID=3363977 RepID=UPI003791EFF8